jgi:hypothetical protein
MLGVEAVQSSKVIRCIECEKEIRIKVRFCPYCGHDVSWLTGQFGTPSKANAGKDLKELPPLEVISAGEIAAPFEEQLCYQNTAVLHGVDAAEQGGESENNRVIAPGNQTSDSVLPRHRRESLARRILIWLGVGAIGTTAAFVYSTPVRQINQKITANPSTPEKLRVLDRGAQSQAKPEPAAVNKAVQPTSDVIRLSNRWNRVPISNDPTRQGISLSASEPFRLRVNGVLYTVNSRSGQAIDFSGAQYMELRQVRYGTNVTITRRAVSGDFE